MFDWLFNLFAPARDEAYRPAERKIYRYWDGVTEVHADPMTLYQKFMDVAPALRTAGKIARSPSKGASEAQRQMVSLVREIFTVKSYEEGGLTYLESLDLIEHFMVFCDTLKKNTPRTPTPPETESPSTGPFREESSPTGASSPSGSSETDNGTGSPKPSGSEPPTPSES